MAGQKILVVDDDQGILRLVEAILVRAGYQIIIASTGETAVEKVRMESPALVLMDVMLPGMDGFQATKLIRRLPNGRAIPIIFLSAMGDVEAKMKGLRGGAVDYIIKPVRAGELLARIEAHLRPGSLTFGQLVNCIGGKSGVGTTTLVINLALALRERSQKHVLIVDYQLPLGEVAAALGLPEDPALEILLAQVHELDNDLLSGVVKEYTPGISVLMGFTDPHVSRQANRKSLIDILRISQSLADYVLVDADSFFAWADPPLSPKGEGLNVCVLTPDPIAVQRAARAIRSAAALGYDVWPVLNRQRASADAPASQVEAQLGVRLQGCLPDEGDSLRRALHDVRPAYLAEPSLDFKRALDDLADRIIGII